MASFAFFEDTAQSIAEAKAGALAHMEGKVASPVSGARFVASARSPPRAREQSAASEPQRDSSHAPPHRRLLALAAPC